MTSATDDDQEISKAIPRDVVIPKLSLTAKFLSLLICPVLLLLAIYETWDLIDLAKSNHLEGDFVAILSTLSVIVVGLMIGLAVAAYHFAQYHASLHHQLRETGLSRRARYTEDLLRVITDNIPNSLFITDGTGHFWFANNEAGRQVNLDSEDMIGKTLDRVFAPRQSSQMLERIKRANKAGAPVITVDRTDDATGPHYTQTYHIPLPDTEDLSNMVMITQKDITDVIIERERQEQTFRQLIDTLVAVVDRRDPYAAGHSLRVGVMAEALALELNLDEQQVEACRIAGSLMNLGKILVPRSILIKTTVLNPEELRLVRKSILTSADILSLISFQVPVIPTLRQVLERVDGGGVPEGRKAENILITARIVAVANAFVALVSPRAHRLGLSIDDAIKSLRAEAGSNFDGKIVETLISYLQNNPDAKQTLMKPPAELRSGIADKDFLND